MKIASSDMLMQSRHSAVQEHERRERLNSWVGERPTANNSNLNADRTQAARTQTAAQPDRLELSQAAQKSLPTKAVASSDTEIPREDELKLALLKRMIESLTGKKLNLASPEDFAAKMEEAKGRAEATAAEFNELNMRAGAAAGNESVGFGIEYDAYERHYESEAMSFSAQGKVTTADGQTIDIAVELNMSREFLREQQISIRAGDAPLKDPLVVNFSGNAAELTTTRFAFDIDSDGRSDQIAFVGPDSGFLALDRNHDGKINDGRELLGPSTGEGFAELAEHDEDANGWIDENDSIYANLRIWSKTADGQDQLVGLGERGVGAIYLGHVTTPFSIKDQDNALLGQVRSSGVFLSETGGAGTVQQIDLAV